MCIEVNATHIIGNKYNIREIGMDSMCSHHVTNLRDLLEEIYEDGKFRISGWNAAMSVINTYGYNHLLGKMIFHAKIPTTLLSYFQMLETFNVRWSSDGSTAVFISKKQSDVKLTAKRSNSGNLLVIDLTNCWTDLIFTPVQACVGDVKGTVDMSSAEYRSVLEYIKFHQYHHIGDETTARGIDNTNLQGYPFTSRVISNAEYVRGRCVACATANATRRSTGERQVKEVPPTTIVERPPAVLEFETLGLDLMFLQDLIFLLAVGKNSGLINVVHLTSKKADVITRAIEIVVLEYRRVRVQVRELFDIYGMEYNNLAASMDLVGLIESDNEGGIIQAGLQLLTKYSIDAVQVPAGEHVSYVERQIRTIKRRVNAMQISIPYKLNHTMLQWLVVNVVNWNNLFPKKGTRTSALANVYCRRFLYTDITRAGYGEFVMAHRPVKAIVAGQGYGELGVCLGFNPKFPGSIFFMGLESGHVKVRARFVKVDSYDSIERFGKNPRYLQPNKIATLQQSKLSRSLDNYVPEY